MSFQIVYYSTTDPKIGKQIKLKKQFILLSVGPKFIGFSISKKKGEIKAVIYSI